MATAIIEKESKTLADLLNAVGDVPLDRIRFPVGDATEDDVVRLLDGDDKHICELIDGILVEKTMGLRESVLAAIICRYLCEFVEAGDLGVTFSTDCPFRLRPGRIRFPDTGFISWDQFPNGELTPEAICDAVPELAIEVISDSNTRKEMELKLHDFFAAGVRLVWYVYPKTKSAVVYTSPVRKKEIESSGSFDGGKVLPGFTLPLAKVFAPLKRRKKA